MGEDSLITAGMLARGLADVHERLLFHGDLVRQDGRMPPRMRRALARLSAQSLRDGADDLGASIHNVMAMAARPMCEWGMPSFQGDFPWANIVLVDGDLGQPTAECFELAAGGGSETELLQEIHHERLRAAAERCGPKMRDRAYREIRGLVVRRPCLPTADLFEFIEDWLTAAPDVQSFYRPLPSTALHGKTLRLCAGCGSPLWPDNDVVSFPNGRCRIRDCRMRHPTCEVAEEFEVTDVGEWRLATNAVLAYWTGPGLAEIEVHDRLKAAGRTVDLYPYSDAADVSVDGRDVGIDVKSYASASLLGARLARSVGQITMFRRRILCVPDARVRQDNGYLKTLKAIALQGEGKCLEFMTVSDVIRELAA
ncbi:hypothetical protein BB934_26370 [Microvirga ossetica]|uniref:REase associating with pPIWI RE domain-containing protein n=1 Tax=Microvirga ossetica TaxID=1882682 RepID=A0A1B2EMW9_9HYPH|nr:hypothetical protein BB934_26370 [Microvirga ossetica]